MNEAVQITIDQDTATPALERITDKAALGAALAGEMDKQNQFTVSHIQQRYMSLPKDGPTSLDGLRTISNRLRASVRASRSEIAEAGVKSAMGSNVAYAEILETGGDTAPHKIVARNAKALAFNGIFRRSVNHPGSHIEGRHYVRRGIMDRLEEYGAAFTRAILRLARTGGAS